MNLPSPVESSDDESVESSDARVSFLSTARASRGALSTALCVDEAVHCTVDEVQSSVVPAVDEVSTALCVSSPPRKKRSVEWLKRQEKDGPRRSELQHLAWCEVLRAKKAVAHTHRTTICHLAHL